VSSRFEGRSVLVTGAGSGIGASTARLFAREGARVVCADLSEEGAENVAADIREAGGDAIAKPCDVSSRDACREAVAFAVQRHGGLRVLANVAGMGTFRRTEEVPEDEWNRILAVNLSGTFFMSQAALEPLLAQEHSAIVNVASLAGLIGQAYTAAYCASKAGVVSLTKTMAVEYVKQGLRVNCVCPGGVATPILKHFIPLADGDPDLQRRMALVPKLAQPEEVAEAIAYLASDVARSVNGTSLPLDYGCYAG